MAELIGIGGGSGSGKTTSVKDLNHKETFVVSITGKNLPFEGFKKRYKRLKKEGDEFVGNFYVSKKVEDIQKIFKLVNIKMPHIKQIVVDDANYLMSFEVMDRAEEKGWDKNVQIAKHYYEMLNSALELRDDLKVVILSHIDNLGDTLNPQWKLKTAGKMLDNQLNVDGLFTYLLYTSISTDGETTTYRFRTNTIDGTDTCKTPMGCFKELYIPNNLKLVLDTIDRYNEGEEEEEEA